jgi:putative hydrolase of the HAD superfamily
VAFPVLIFDLDDTLYPEWEYIAGGFRAAASALEGRWGIPSETTYRELESIFSASSDVQVFDEWLSRRRMASPVDQARELMLQAYREDRGELHLFPDAAWALEHLGADHRLGLLTDGRSGSQRHKIDALGIAGRFEAIVVTDEMGLSWRKPDPRGFRSLLEQFGCRAEDAAYIGDNPAKDFAAPALLGMGSVRVRRPGGRHSASEARHPGDAALIEIASLYELEKALGA